MNVLLISPTPPPRGGIAQWSNTILDASAKDPDLNIVHINSASSSKTIVERSVWERYVGSLIKIFKMRGQIKFLSKQQSFDAAHLTTSAGFGSVRDFLLLRLLKRLNIRTVYHLHFGRYKEVMQSHSLWKRFFVDAINHADVMIAIDPVTLDAATPTRKAVLIPNPIEEVEYSYSQEKSIIYLGWVLKTKGVEDLLTAWEKIKEKFPDWNLKIVGPYNELYLRELKTRFSCNNVYFMGEMPHDKAMQEVKKASVLTLPSHSEGFPYSICEAMFAGKTIVASDVGAIPMLLDDMCGVVCKRMDVDDLANCLKKVIEDESLRKTLSENAARKAREKLSVSRVMEQYKSVWKKN